MKNMSFWKIFFVVFVTTFATSTAISFLWNLYFHENSWQWDTTTTTAIVAGLVVTFILNRKRRSE